MKLSSVLTIAIPVFERTDFFAESLGSALRQTVPTRILVVDNASSHDYFQRHIESLRDNRICYVRNDSNLGMYGNWNRCAELSTTPFFMILGDDDVLDYQYVEIFLETLRRYPEIQYFFTDIERFGDRFVAHGPSRMPFGYISGDALVKNAIDVGLGFITVSMVLSKSIFEKYAFEYPKWAYSQDWLFVYSALPALVGVGCPRKLLKYRVHAKGNALAVGARAYLSTCLVYHRISDGLRSCDLYYSTRARKCALWVVRNAVLSGRAGIVREMASDMDPENPFALVIRAHIDRDLFLRLGLSSNCMCRWLGVVMMRLIRRIMYLRSLRTLNRWPENLG